MLPSEILTENKGTPQVFGEYLDCLGGYCANGIILREIGFTDDMLMSINDTVGYNGIIYDEWYTMKKQLCYCDNVNDLDLHDLIMHWNDDHKMTLIQIADRLKKLERRGVISEA